MSSTAGPRLFAISDLHVGIAANRAFVSEIPASPGDWLILGGDLGETPRHVAFVLETLRDRYARLFWVPGNHELWSTEPGATRGVHRYAELVELCRHYGVHTPEDPYVPWPGPGPKLVIVPMFLLYDYSFRPPDVPRARALAWAEETGIVCADEALLHHDGYPSRDAWCAARCAATEARLRDLPEDVHTILINHWPLRQTHAFLPRIPRFSLWCGTTRTDDWHVRYRARAVVFGHLHIRQRRDDDGVAFHEVSLGNPGQWSEGDPRRYLRPIWPPPDDDRDDR